MLNRPSSLGVCSTTLSASLEQHTCGPAENHLHLVDECRGGLQDAAEKSFQSRGAFERSLSVGLLLILARRLRRPLCSCGRGVCRREQVRQPGGDGTRRKQLCGQWKTGVRVLVCSTTASLGEGWLRVASIHMQLPLPRRPENRGRPVQRGGRRSAAGPRGPADCCTYQ